MTQGLRRYYGGQHLHFITASCYHRRALLGSGPRRDVFLCVLEEVRGRYGFVVVGTGNYGAGRGFCGPQGVIARCTQPVGQI